jgi:hypothetical protein
MRGLMRTTVKLKHFHKCFYLIYTPEKLSHYNTQRTTSWGTAIWFTVGARSADRQILPLTEWPNQQVRELGDGNSDCQFTFTTKYIIEVLF